jgi:GT2 family glycosyltransferase
LSSAAIGVGDNATMPEPADVHLVIPTLGRRVDMLVRSMDSVAAQSHPVRTTVLAGDNLAAIRELCTGRRDVTVVAQEGTGLSRGINQAWRHDAWSSEFTGWLGDDDALPPMSVEIAVARLRRDSKASMVHGTCLVIDGAGQPLRVARNGRAAAFLIGYGRNLIAQPGSLFRTSAVHAVGGLDEGLALAMDVDLYARLKRIGPVRSVREQLGVFREHADSLSTAQRHSAAAEVRSARRAVDPAAGRRAVSWAVTPVTAVVNRVLTALPPPAAHYWRP